MTTQLQSIAAELAFFAGRLRRSTVQIGSQRGGYGSGVIWSADGLIVTNAHVIQGSRATVSLADGRIQILEAQVIAQDPQRDLAALQVAAANLPAVTVGDSKALRAGELVLAVGNPQGIAGAVTTGIIYSANPLTLIRATPQRRFGRSLRLQGQEWIVADIRLAPGNSGGPLANAKGQVIGINTMIAGGLALAVSSQEVERFLASRRLTSGVVM